MAKQTEQTKLPKQFGMFYPRGYVILAFRAEEEAERVWQLLVDGGYDEDDVRVMDRARVMEGSSGDLEHLSPLIKLLGSESDILESHKSGAASGQTFLIAYAPSDLDTQRLMNVARRVGYVSAQKYDRFTFTKL
jgi:hypothetical protein